VVSTQYLLKYIERKRIVKMRRLKMRRLKMRKVRLHITIAVLLLEGDMPQ